MKKYFILSLTILVIGCSGNNFVRPNSDSFKLGQATYSQIMQQMGSPGYIEESVINGKKFKAISYTYSDKFGEPSEEGILPFRTIVFFLHNDVLVSFGFFSSFKSDSTNYDDMKIGSIKKGKTTRTEVIELLGNPAVSSIAPFVKEPSVAGIAYGYYTTRRDVLGKGKKSKKYLSLLFDGRGVVADIEYTSSEHN